MFVRAIPRTLMEFIKRIKATQEHNTARKRSGFNISGVNEAKEIDDESLYKNRGKK